MIGKSPCQPEVFECPPEDFNPIDASSDTLLRFGFPLRPDAETHPRLNAFWFRMFSPPLKFRIKREFALFNQAPPGDPRSAVANQRNTRLFSTRRQSSVNWSGAYIKPRNGRVMTEIHGEWQVPPTLERSVPPAVSFPDRDYQSSVWIGLDGQRRYYQSSMPQIGIGLRLPSDDDGGTVPTYEAWWQWWDREGDADGNPMKPLPIEEITINPEDRIMCSLFVVDASPPAQVKFIIKNQTTGEAVTPFTVPAPVRPIPLSVSGATAEWVTERPSIWPTPDQYNFPDYGHVDFEGCFAVQTLPGGGGSEERNLLGARLIDMREVRHNPQRTAKISVTGRTTEHTFQTTYQTS